LLDLISRSSSRQYDRIGDHRLDLGDLAPLLVDLKLIQTDKGFA
jgi:hypothetical protein